MHTKEEADHSLPYMVAVALLDGEVTPAQYLPERIVREDVQRLLRQVAVHASLGVQQALSRPRCACRITIQSAGWPGAHRREARLRGLSHAANVVGAAVQKLEAAEPLNRDGGYAARDSQMRSPISMTIQTVDLARLLDTDHVVAAPRKATVA